MQTLFITVLAVVMPLADASSQRADRQLPHAEAVNRATQELSGNHDTSASFAPGDEQQADSLFRAAQDAFTRGDYRRAAELFRSIADRYPNTSRAPNALYFHAFALSRTGSTGDLRTALESLDALEDKYPNSQANRGDASNLRIRVCGQLMQRGDETCARTVAAAAQPQPVQQGRSCPRPDDENDERIMALNALLNMSADLAVPLLERTLARTDECYKALRLKAVFLLSQKQTERTADMLLKVAREDPSPEVREQAIFWLGNVRDPRVVDLLSDMALNSGDAAAQEKAIFALTQTRSERGFQVIRSIAENARLSNHVREHAIFWLGQQRNTENAEFLRGLYGRINDEALKEKIIFSLSQQRGMGNEAWVLALALNENESVALRKQAIFWAGQQGAVSTADLAAMYDRMRNVEMKEQVIFTLSQKRDSAAIDKLMDIARSDPNRDLRGKAIFWLGQLAGRDPRILRFLEDIVNKG